jgi:O-antigen ligase
VGLAALLALVGLALARGHWSVSLLLAGALTVSATAVMHPRGYRLAGYAMVVLVPFGAAAEALRPADYNYAIYVAAFLCLLGALGAYQPRALPRTTGTLYLGYVLVASLLTLTLSFGVAQSDRAVYIVMGFGLYVLLWRGDRPERDVFLSLIVAFAAIQSVLALSQALFEWPAFPAVLPELLTGDRNYFAYLLPGVSSTVTQGSGTFAHFNYLGAVLALAVPLTFGLWLERLASPLRALAFLLCAAGLVATFSRGALLGAVVGMTLTLVMQPSRDRRRLVLIGLCIVGLVGLLAVNTAAQYYESTENVGIRISTWQTTVGDAADRPTELLFGYGFDHYHGQVLRAGLGGQTVTVRSTVMASLHSGYVQLLLEFGLVGVALFGIWLFSFTRKAVRSPRSARRVTLLAAAIAFLAHQAVENALFSFASVLFVGIVAILERDADDSTEPSGTFLDGS